MRSHWFVFVIVAGLAALALFTAGCAGAGDTPSHPVYAHCI
jgi:hypothetical protein